MNKPRTIIIFALLLLLPGFIHPATGQGITQEDTALVNDLLETGRVLHYSSPDSAIFYYQLIFDHPALKRVSPGNELPELDLAFLRTVIRALNYTGNIYYYDDQFNRSEYYYQRALEIAELSGQKNYVARALFDIGYIRYVTNAYSEAEKLFEESGQLYEETGNVPGRFDALHARGLTSRRLGNYEVADSSYREALEVAEILNDSILMADVWVNLGILLCEQARLEEGIILFEKALDHYERINDKRAVSLALLNIGVVLKMVEEYEKSLSYIQRSTHIEELQGNKSQLVVRYYNLADLYLEMGENEKAFEYCQKIESVASEIGSQPFKAECNFLMGKYYFLEDELEKAGLYFRIAADSAMNSNHQPLITNILLWRAKTAIRLDNLREAIRHGLQAHQNAQAMNQAILEKEATEVLFNAYEKMGDLGEALQWHKQLMSLSDSISYSNKQKEISKIEAKYNYDKKERENELLRNTAALQDQKLRNRKIATIALIMGIGLSIAIIFLLFKRNRDARLLYKQQQMLHLQKLEEIEKELDGKQRELASKMMFLNQKNELINRIIRGLQEIQDSPEQSTAELGDILSELRVESPESNWKEFETQFNQVHPDFYKRLYEKHPGLTSYEQRICAFLRMNLNSKEISAITGRSLKSIEVTRSRIRKKVGLSRKDNLNSFLASV
jgi:tetratricopeptide (TPR) repeat protein